MKKMLLYIVLFIVFGTGALLLGSKKNINRIQDSSGGVNVLGIDSSFLTSREEVATSSPSKRGHYEEDMQTSNNQKSKNPRLKKESFKGHSSLRKSNFSTVGMSDSEYKVFNDSENKINFPLIVKSFTTVLDVNKDGIVSPEEKAEFEKEIEQAGKALEESIKEAKKTTLNESEKTNNMIFENALREVRDEYYRQYGYDFKNGFPQGQREQMNEQIVRELPNVLKLIGAEVRKQSTKSLAL